VTARPALVSGLGKKGNIPQHINRMIVSDNKTNEKEDTEKMLWRKRVLKVLGVLILPACLLLIHACTSGESRMDRQRVTEFAAKYTQAWCSQNAASVASFFAENGSLQINEGEPSVGRAAITEAAQGFMTAFPDMVVKMDSLIINGNNAEYHWTLAGTNTGPGGNGNAVRISGYEEWTFGADSLIAESKGYFDETEYQRQLEYGAEEQDMENSR